LVLNLEARGSSGPGYMLMETNEGNAKMVDAFSNGNVRYPVSNSLMYSIYKMLPNDTDLTVFREQGKFKGLTLLLLIIIITTQHKMMRNIFAKTH
jgi:hypothetical protein